MEARLKLPRLYAIADRETLDRRGVSVRAFAEQLCEGGVRLVQYRDKKNGPQEVLRTAAEIAAVFDGTGATLIMNDRADLASLLGWGCHVGQGDLPAEAAWRVLGDAVPHTPREKMRDEWATRDGADYPSEMHGSLSSAAANCAAAAVEMTSIVVGISTHSVAQVVDANRSTASYVAVGPVFATSSKPDAEPVVALDGVRRARDLTSKPLVAIGGISLENALSVVDAGADSVAVISGLFLPDRSIADAARDFLGRLG